MRLGILEDGHDLPTRVTFRVMRTIARAEVPAVIKVSSYRHRYFGTPFHALVQDLLRGPSEWTVGERELFAAATSKANQCRFCTTAHTAFAADQVGADVAADVLRRPQDAAISPQTAAALAFLEKLALEPDAIGPDDADAVRAAGVSDEALDEAIRVSVLFHVINRVMDTAGAGPLEGRSLAVARKVVGTGGYRLPPTIRLLSRAG